jgi:LuxR family maltose regulon positive regulatory protein
MLAYMTTAMLLDPGRLEPSSPWGGAHAAPSPRRVLETAVRRPRLVRLLPRAGGDPLVALVAPAGYGKTTLLCEWDERDRRPFAWVALDERDNDAGRLLARVARAVDGAVGEDGETPFVLVLDDVGVLRDTSAIRALHSIATDLPYRASLALASRTPPPLPLARMRAQRLVREIGPAELAMTRTEATALLSAAGHDLDREDIETLMQRTEGWPVGLALAALFLDDPGAAGDFRRFDGADRLVADYVRDEVLADLPPGTVHALLSTSVLDTLTGPSCDAVTQRPDSAALLAELAGTGLLVPLDRANRRFRHHRLVAGALQAELRRVRPGLERDLHRRASAWHRQDGDVDRAIRHALQAGDVRRAGDLVWDGVPGAVAQGRVATIELWLSRFSPAQIAGHAPLALTAAGSALVMGQGHLVEHWADAAARAPKAAERAADVQAGVAVARAVLGRSGPAGMLDDLALARGLACDDGLWHALRCFVSGTAKHLLGLPDDARVELEEGARRAAVTAPQVHALCLAKLAVLSLEAEDWEHAAALITRARAQVDRHALGRYPTTALVFAASAAVRAHRGRVESAQDDLQDADRLRGMLTDFAPWYEAEVGVLLSGAALRLSDVRAAREQLERSSRLVSGVPGAAALEASVAAARARVELFSGSGDGAPPSSMTAAELRILGFLPTHLSFREIAARTFVSANTVKTQANAVYRKLDVSCRSDAVARARACGLLDV